MLDIKTIELDGVTYDTETLSDEVKGLLALHQRLVSDFELERIKVERALQNIKLEIAGRVRESVKASTDGVDAPVVDAPVVDNSLTDGNVG